jgi:hypothetical protein
MPRFLAVAVTLTLVASSASPNFASAGSLPSVRFSFDEHGAVIIPVLVNGSGPFRFLVDTGSNASAISDQLATRLQTPVVAKAEVVTPAGRAVQAVGRIERLEVGNVAAEAMVATILPAAALAAAAPGLDGVLGQDFLRTRAFTLDYRHQTLTWNAPVDDRDAVRLPLVMREGRVLVELPQGNDRVVRLVPDSGSDGLVLFTRGGDAPLPIDLLPARTQLTSLAGSTGVRPAIVRQLKIGTMTLRDQPAITVARTETDAPDGDGLLPLHRFSSVTFDASGYIVLRR